MHASMDVCGSMNAWKTDAWMDMDPSMEMLKILCACVRVPLFKQCSQRIHVRSVCSRPPEV